MNDIQINELDVHDGKLLGVFSIGGRAAVFVQAVGGQIFTICLNGVYRIEVSDFYEGNIIFDIQVVSDPVVVDEALTTLLRGESPDRGLPRLRSLMEAEGHQVFIINPAYGASVIALVKSIHVESGFAEMNGLLE